MRRLAFLLLLAGCSPVAPVPAGGDPFARELAGRTAGPPQTCVSTNHSQGLRAVDSQTVVYELGRTLWVNRLDQACPAISPHNTIIVEAHGAQYCRGDHIRGHEPGAVIPGPSCTLRDWVPHRRR
jgi:hypothetical protein